MPHLRHRQIDCYQNAEHPGTDVPNSTKSHSQNHHCHPTGATDNHSMKVLSQQSRRAVSPLRVSHPEDDLPPTSRASTVVVALESQQPTRVALA